MQPSFKSERPSVATWIGLFISLFGILIVRWVVGVFYPTLTLTATLWKESLIWLCVVVLFVVIRRGERLPLSSVNIGTRSAKSSIVWGGLVTLLCSVVAVVVVPLTHFKGGETGQVLSKLPLWLVLLVVLRAGVVEELFYRGYAIERLQSLGLNRYFAGIIPLLIFGFAHVTNGWANVVVALAIGSVLMAVYLWRRDLVANMLGHFMVDFISVVLPRLVSHR